MFITKENLLANIESIGKYFKDMISPYSHPYDDERRAKPYIPMYRLSQLAWYDIYHNKDINSTLLYFYNCVKKIQTFESYKISTLIDAVSGKLEFKDSDFKNIKEKYFYITYEGDLFGITIGDKLNRSIVQRMANINIPFDERSEEQLRLSKKISTMIPNFKSTVQIL